MKQALLVWLVMNLSMLAGCVRDPNSCDSKSDCFADETCEGNLCAAVEAEKVEEDSKQCGSLTCDEDERCISAGGVDQCVPDVGV